jgi:hypothetical protein
MLQRTLLALLFAVGLASAGCGNRHIVRSAPPSVSTPPRADTRPIPAPSAPTPVEVKKEEPLPTPIPPPPPEPEPPKRPAPPRPRPAQSEPVEPPPAAPTPKPAPPEISPQLSPKELEAAKNNTTSDITTAEKKLQLAKGKQLKDAQKDLVEKINGFLSQAHEAILANDWVRAHNLAEKARILSEELAKSL